MTENELKPQGTCLKPPLGVKPGWLICEEHIDDLIAAIIRIKQYKTQEVETIQQLRNRNLAIARYAGELKEFVIFWDKLKYGGATND